MELCSPGYVDRKAGRTIPDPRAHRFRRHGGGLSRCRYTPGPGGRVEVPQCRRCSRIARARERFEREARAASALNHPNICTVYGVDEFEGHPYLAMELLKGQTLADVISEGSRSPSDRLLEFAIPVLSALEAAHAEGIIHRDLKPANIFLTEKGQVKILDFGLAKQTALVHGRTRRPSTSMLPRTRRSSPRPA